MNGIDIRRVLSDHEARLAALEKAQATERPAAKPKTAKTAKTEKP